MSGDTHDLQFKKSPAQQWFLGVYRRTSAPLLNAQKSFSNDSQGMYIVGPDGTSYAYTNDHDPSNINEAMDQGLAAYRARPPARIVLTDRELRAPFALSPAASTSVVRVFSRIRPVPNGCTWLNRGPGRDFLWVYKDEVQQMVAPVAARRPLTIPAALGTRICRYHLVDNVRGTPDLWTSDEVRKASFAAHMVSDDAYARVLSFRGSFAMKARSGRRGYAGTIEGEIALDKRNLRVSRFRAYAAGAAFGDGTYTPNAPKGRFNLAVAMVEAHDAIARVVPPEAVSTENRDISYHHPLP